MAKKIDLNGLDHFKEKENAMIASEYSSSKTYAVGDYCYHAGTLYCCTTAITTAENWTAGHWTAAKLADDTSALKTAITQLESQSGGIANTIENVPIASFDDGTASAVKQIVVGIEPVQSGSGDPAPDNVRPITGWAGAIVNVSDADTSTPTVYNITFPAGAGTVYGGTLTINEDGSGELVIDRVNVSLTENAVTNSWLDTGRDSMGFYRSNWGASGYPTPSSGSDQLFDYCKVGVVYDTNNIWNARFLFSSGNFNRFEIRLPRSVLATEDVAGARAYLNAHPLQAVYKVTPTTYQLTTQQVITLLEGTNNVWADTGNIIQLQYYADSKGYIDTRDSLVKALIAKELPSMVADTALTANDFRIVNNTLYRVTTSIASGATLTVGTNVVATTLAEVIKPLLS